jgi:hypothetical protein
MMIDVWNMILPMMNPWYFFVMDVKENTICLGSNLHCVQCQRAIGIVQGAALVIAGPLLIHA